MRTRQLPALQAARETADVIDQKFGLFKRGEFIESLTSVQVETPGTPYTSNIASIDITGDVAVAKVTDDCFGTTFTDYLTSIKHDGRWPIVMKAFFDQADTSDPD